LGSWPIHANRAELERGLAELEAAMGAEWLAAARADGHAVALEDALGEAGVLADAGGAADAVQAAPGTPPATWRAADLTAREYEVARLLAQGLSNRQIAHQLVIAEKTTKNHVQRVLEKLDVRSRAEVAARAVELGLRRPEPATGQTPSAHG